MADELVQRARRQSKKTELSVKVAINKDKWKKKCTTSACTCCLRSVASVGLVASERSVQATCPTGQ